MKSRKITAKRAVLLHQEDNVANVVEDIRANDTVEYTLAGKKHHVTAIADIPFGFKLAVKDISEGSAIVKYAQTIGRSTADIQSGDLVHIHNVEGTRGRGDRSE